MLQQERGLSSLHHLCVCMFDIVNSIWRADVCLLSPMWASNSLKSPPPHQNSCSNTSGPQSMAVWATANTAAPSVADSPHTAIFTILFPLPHSWPRSRGKAASRPESILERIKAQNKEEGSECEERRHGGVERNQNAGGWTKAGSSCILLLGLKIKKGSRDVNKLGAETRRRWKQTKNKY